MLAAIVLLLATQHLHSISSFQLPPSISQSQPLRQRHHRRGVPLAAGSSSPAGTDTPAAMSSSKAAQQAEGLIIVGAGIAGLATAAALRSIAGIHTIHLVEKFDERTFRDHRSGAGAQLGPNGLRALRAIGGEDLVERTIAAGTKLVGNAICLPTPPGPMLIPDSVESETGLPQVLLRWGALRALLADVALPKEDGGVGGVSVAFDAGEDVTGYKSVDDDSGGVSLIGASGKTIGPANKSVPLIVAADGIYSTFRTLVRTGATELTSSSDDGDGIQAARKEGVKYNRRINIKAAVPSELLGEAGFEPGHTYAYFTPGGGVACFAGPAGEGYSYWAISIVDDAADATSEEQDDDGDESERDAVVELASTIGAEKSELKDALLSKLRQLDEPLCQFVIDKIEETDPRYILVSPSEEAAEIGPNLVSSDGRVVLVGDAAHAMSPAYGQGANFALEDAASLAVCVRDAEGDLTSALETYGASRVERCREMQRRSAERAAKAMKGEQTEDVTKWIFQWDVPKGV